MNLARLGDEGLELCRRWHFDENQVRSLSVEIDASHTAVLHVDLYMTDHMLRDVREVFGMPQSAVPEQIP